MLRQAPESDVDGAFMAIGVFLAGVLVVTGLGVLMAVGAWMMMKGPY